MNGTTEKVRCDHIPCGCFMEQIHVIAEGGGFFCAANCAKHPLTGDKCACGHPGCR